jgi:zinc/manganese transport system substrate-binding protein
LTLGPAWLASGFDPGNARVLGVPVRATEAILLMVAALVVVAMLSALGALLAASLVVIPAAATRLWFDRLPSWQVATVITVLVIGSIGLLASVELNTPPGATIVTLCGAVFTASALARMLFAARATRFAGLATIALALAVFSGCGGGDDQSTEARAIATTTQVGDFVRAVAGEDAGVIQILQPNSDPHDYEVRPDDVKAASTANVVFASGDGLDEWARKLVEDSGGDARIVDLSKSVHNRSARASSIANDPHWWHNPRNVRVAVERIAKELGKVDPSRADTFQENAKTYNRRIARLDAAVERCIDRLLPSQRRLVTSHDAFNYYARRYGIDVIGAAIPAQTTQAQASAGDVAELIATIKRERVKAIFPESSVNPELARSIARETGVSSDLELYGDTLGPKRSSGATYIGMVAANTKAIVDGLSGGESSCAIPLR